MGYPLIDLSKQFNREDFLSDLKRIKEGIPSGNWGYDLDLRLGTG